MFIILLFPLDGESMVSCVVVVVFFFFFFFFFGMFVVFWVVDVWLFISGMGRPISSGVIFSFLVSGVEFTFGSSCPF